ncbi:MAG: hypothetical protein PSV16_07820 [Flavobacterium sp.]|nr:hypothetical protein [Flavobacterium sp.]
MSVNFSSSKYDIILHPVSIALWIWVIYANYEKYEAHSKTINLIGLLIGIFLLGVSIFNLVRTIKKMKQKLE